MITNTLCIGKSPMHTIFADNLELEKMNTNIDTVPLIPDQKLKQKLFLTRKIDHNTSPSKQFKTFHSNFKFDKKNFYNIY